MTRKYAAKKHYFKNGGGGKEALYQAMKDITLEVEKGFYSKGYLRKEPLIIDMKNYDANYIPILNT